MSSAALILGPWVSKLIPKFNKVLFFCKEFTIFCSTWLPITEHWKHEGKKFQMEDTTQTQLC